MGYDDRPQAGTGSLVDARRRMEGRLLAGLPPGQGDLKTMWEAYQVAVSEGRMWGEQRLPDELVAAMKADHDALVRELRRYSS